MLRFVSTILVIALAAAQPADHQTITVNVDLVNIYFTVHNHRGRLVPNLAREKFAVFEDGEPQIITNFSRETDAPLTLVLLIDTSGSVHDKLRFEQTAATDFVYGMVRRGIDKAALFTFDHFIELQQNYTDDPALLAAALRRLRAAGGTRLFDALHLVMQEKLVGPEERKVIILVTDGDDNCSHHSPQEVVDLAQRNNVSIYSISMNALGTPPSRSEQSDRVLEMLSTETGGAAFFPTKLEKLAADFKQIDNELRSQYAIGYRSTNSKRDGAFRNIRIEVKGRKAPYSVHARAGYYAPTEAMAKGR